MNNLCLHLHHLNTQLTPESPILGVSGLIESVRRTIVKLLNTDGNVLLQGEAGTGKRLVALRIHLNGTRKDGPFMVVECPDKNMEQHLLESLTAAQDGVVFIEYVTALGMDLQKKLANALQGGHSNTRIISSSRDSLGEHVKKGRFREDLYNKLNEHFLELPPLRTRPEDIPQLANYFVQLFSKRYGKPVKEISPRAMELLQQYYWPGNIAQLRNTVERLVLVEKESHIREELLPVEIHSAPKPGREDIAFKQVRKAGEKQMLVEMLRKYRGNQAEVARLMGVHRNTVINKVREFGLKPREYRRKRAG